MIRRPPRSTPLYSSAASDVYKRQANNLPGHLCIIKRPNNLPGHASTSINGQIIYLATIQRRAASQIIYTTNTWYRRQTHVRTLANPATTPPHSRSQRQQRDLSRVTEGQRRPLLIHEINFENNSTSLNDVEFSKNTHVQHVVELTDARRIKRCLLYTSDAADE